MSLKDPFNIDLSTADLSDPKAVRVILNHLSNLVEALHRENLALKAENQRLKDEINRLKVLPLNIQQDLLIALDI